MQPLLKAENWYSRLALIFAFVIFSAAQVYLTAGPFLNRSIPVEADDAYGYIAKAEEMRTCFLQDCPALTTLREQLQYKTGDEQIAYSQVREYHRLFVVYHPLHSFLLNGLHLAGLSFETSYFLLAALAKLALCAGIAYWLKGLFGQNATALTLILLSPVVFVGTGIHTIVPSTIALALAFWLWGLLAHKHPKAITFSVPLALGMMLFHQIGQIYTAMAIGMYVWKNFRAILNSKKEQGFVLALGLLTGFFLVLPRLVSRPAMSFDPTLFYPYDWNPVAELIPANLRSLEIIGIWFGAFTFPVIGLGLVAYGVYAAWRLKASEALRTLLFVSLQAILGMLYVVPWFGALSFERTWIPMAILLTGFVGLGVITAGNHFKKVYFALRMNRKVSSTPLRLEALLAAFILLAFGAAGITYPVFYVRHYSLTLASQMERQDFVISAEQPQSVFAQPAKPNELLLYMQELPLYYYMTIGGLNRGAVFFPAVWNSGQESYWLQERLPDIKYLVALNPVPWRNGIAIDENMQIEPTSDSGLRISSFEIHVRNPGEAVLATVTWLGPADSTSTTLIPENYDGWLQFATTEAASSITLEAEGLLYLQGLRFDPLAKTSWPWDAEIRLTTVMTTVDISKTILLQGLPFRINVIDDNGAIVLAEVKH